MFAARLCPFRVLSTTFNRHAQLTWEHFEQGRLRTLIHPESPAGESEITELGGETQPVPLTSPLADDGEIRIGQREVLHTLHGVRG